MAFDPILLEAHNPGPMTGSGNNTYLLMGSDARAALVDAGVGEPRHLAAIASRLSTSHATLADVIVTHAHSDHVAGVPSLATAHERARFHKHPCPPVVTADTADTDDPDDVARCGVQWHTLKDGDRLSAGGEWLTVVHTPGHAPDHVALWHEPSGTAFTGDLVVGGSSVMIAPSHGGDLRAYLTSLECVRALGARRLLPAHGPEVTDPTKVLNSYLEHRRHRERQVIEALRAGRETVQAIAESIYHGLDRALIPAARENVLAHLVKLRYEGRVADEQDRWRLAS